MVVTMSALAFSMVVTAALLYVATKTCGGDDDQ